MSPSAIRAMTVVTAGPQMTYPVTTHATSGLGRANEIYTAAPAARIGTGLAVQVNESTNRTTTLLPGSRWSTCKCLPLYQTQRCCI